MSNDKQLSQQLNLVFYTTFLALSKPFTYYSDQHATPPLFNILLPLVAPLWISISRSPHPFTALPHLSGFCFLSALWFHVPMWMSGQAPGFS